MTMLQTMKQTKFNYTCANPNCTYRGPAAKKARGSLLVAGLLLCFGILPGVIYLILRDGYDLLCPECGMTLGKE